MFSNIKSRLAKVSGVVGGVAMAAYGLAAKAAVDPDIVGTNTPINNFVDYGKENILGVVGVVLLGVGAIFAVSLGIKLAFRWFHRAAK